MHLSARRDRIPLITGYLACIVLVPVYVNMFPVWKYLSIVAGASIFRWLPAAALALLLGAAIALFRRRGSAAPVNGTLVALGIVFCLIGLAVPDPDFPVKRVHVAQYALLALVARFAMSHRLEATPLLLFPACFAALLGVHDEFLQGLHPQRTYGLRDMAVNVLGSCGGALVWHGLGVFSRAAAGPTAMRSSPGPHKESHPPPRRLIEAGYLAWLLLGVPALAVPALFYRGLGLPLWPALPLIGAVVCLAVYQDRIDGATRHGVLALSLASFALIAYPPLSRTGAFMFY